MGFFVDMFLERKPLISYRPMRLALLRSTKRVLTRDIVADVTGNVVGEAVKTSVTGVVSDAVRNAIGRRR